MQLKFHIFTDSNVFAWKSFLKKIFEVQSWGTRFFGILSLDRNFAKKTSKNRIMTSGGRISCGIHPNLIFSSLGFPCGQNESYTSFIRPFLMIFYSCEVGPLLTEFPRNRIFDDLRTCDFTGKKHNLLRKLFFRIIIFLKLCI